MLTLAKLRRAWYQRIYFLKLYMCVYLRTKFQVASIILTSFRRGVISPPPPPPPPPQNESLKSLPRVRLNLKLIYRTFILPAKFSVYIYFTFVEFK